MKRMPACLVMIIVVTVFLLSSCDNKEFPKGGFDEYYINNAVEMWIDHINDGYEKFNFGDIFVGRNGFNKYEAYVMENPTDILFYYYVPENGGGTGSYFICAYNESSDAQFGMEYMLEQLKGNTDSNIAIAIDNLGDDNVKNLLNCALVYSGIANGSLPSFGNRDEVLTTVINELRDYPEGREPFINKKHVKIEPRHD